MANADAVVKLIFQAVPPMRDLKPGERVVMRSLETNDLGATGSASVADGGTLVFRLAYAPKDKV